MKKIIQYTFLIFIITFTLIGCSNAETGKLYYKDTDTINYEGEMIDGAPHGNGIAYNEKGQIFYEGNF